MEPFLLRSGTGQEYHWGHFYNFNIQVLARAIRQEKERKDIKIGNQEVTLLFVDDMYGLIYTKITHTHTHAHTYTHTLLDMINESNEVAEVAGYRLNTQQ